MHMKNKEDMHAKLKAKLWVRNQQCGWSPTKVEKVKLQLKDTDEAEERHGPSDKQVERRHGPTADDKGQGRPTDDREGGHSPEPQPKRLPAAAAHALQNLRAKSALAQKEQAPPPPPPPPPAPPPGLAPLSVLSRKKVVIATAGYNTLTWAFPCIHAARQLARSTWVSDTDVADALDDCGWQMGLVIGALKFRDPSKQTDHLGLHPSNMHGLVQNTQSLRSIFAKVCISSCCKVVCCVGVIRLSLSTPNQSSPN